MQPLIDGDVLLYEIGFCGEYLDPETGELLIREWDFVQELLDAKIKLICEEVDATEAPIIFITGKRLNRELVNRSLIYRDEEPVEFLPNFRDAVATVKPYKGTRKSEKPFHFDNITAYLLGNYRCHLSNGLEADDLLCIHQYGRTDTIICSRDKDVRQCPGWHYSWECGAQPSFGPTLVDNKGAIWKDRDKVRGVGTKFFFYQMLVGDSVDNIPGCPKVGPVKAYALLADLTTRDEHERAVISAYLNCYPDNYIEMIEEQSKLLWMIREYNEDGTYKHYDWRWDGR
jgi:hypothetical protein